MTDEPEELHLPFNGHQSDPDSHQEWDDDEDLYGDEAAAPAVARTRPPPKGLSRRERHEWRRLEVARVQRETQAAEEFSYQRRTGWGKGFIRNPPRGLGRKGRRAWLAAEHEATRAWWVQRRASDRDIDTRAAGVLIVVLLLGAGLFYLALFGHHRGDASTASAAASADATAPAAPAVPTSTAQTPTSVPTSAAAATTVFVVPGAGNQAAVPGAGTGPQPVAGHWQPTQAGGITPIPAPTAAELATVNLVPQPTGPATAAELATPVGAVTAWLARTCPSRYTQRYGADVAAGRAVMTTAGWAAAKQQLAADTTGPQLWKTAAAARQTRTCGDLDVQRSTDAATGGGVAFVEYTAHRVVTTPGRPDRVEQLTGAWMAIRQGDGRWLVDRPVVGG